MCVSGCLASPCVCVWSFHINVSHVDSQGSPRLWKERKEMLRIRGIGGQPLASSATVSRYKGTCAFVLKGEPLGLGDLCPVTGLERPWRGLGEEAGTCKHFCALTWVSWLTLTGNSTHKSTDCHTDCTLSPGLSYLTPLWLASKTGVALRGEETEVLTSSESQSIGGWLTAPFLNQSVWELISSLTLPSWVTLDLWLSASVLRHSHLWNKVSIFNKG